MMGDSLTQFLPAPWCHRSLVDSVAQRFMVGFQGGRIQDAPEWNLFLTHWCPRGLGGVILFRQNVQPYEAPLSTDPEPGSFSGDVAGVLEMIHGIAQVFPQEPLLRPWIAIDQEGGRVERLGPTLFPSIPSPMALGLAKDPHLARQSYDLLAQRLCDFGVNLNFCPTLDVNVEAENPVIGMRAFGNDPDQVWELGQEAIAAHIKAGVMPVVKHFPGHGNGRIDSHLSLPTLVADETSLSPFKQAIAAKVPAVLVAHGYYPDWMGDIPAPSSLSRRMVHQLLREELGFEGLIITDDMTMGALTQYASPPEAAIQAVAAGNDLLVYQWGNDEVRQAIEAVALALESGQLSIEEHGQALNRIAETKARFPGSSPSSLASKEALQQRLYQEPANYHGLHYKAMTVLSGNVNLWAKAWQQTKTPRVLVVAPPRTLMRNYGQDIPTSPGLISQLNRSFQASGFDHAYQWVWWPDVWGENRGNSLLQWAQDEPQDGVDVMDQGLEYWQQVQRPDPQWLQEQSIDHVLVVTWCPDGEEGLVPWLDTLVDPESGWQGTVLVCSAAMPLSLCGVEALDRVLHLSLGSYRPVSMEALAEWLIHHVGVGL